MFTPLILLHLCAASASLLLGAVVLFRTKGTATHRWLGRVWVALMLITAISSFWICRNGQWSWIHLLSVWIIVSMALSIRAIRHRQVATHVRFMRGSYIGLVAAGVLTLLPFRRLGALLWHAVGVS